jgi:hypothetical protein
LGRIRTAELNTSVSALVRGFLEDLAGDESEAQRRRRLINSLLDRLNAQGLGPAAGNREALHRRR